MIWKGLAVEQRYKRGENLDEKIKNISLPYLEWKLLFLIAEDTSEDDLVEVVKEDKELIAQAIKSLESNGLVEIVEKSEEVPETLEEKEPEETAAKEDLESGLEEVTEETDEEKPTEGEKEEMIDIGSEIKEESQDEESDEEHLLEELEEEPEKDEQEDEKSEMAEFLEGIDDLSKDAKETKEESHVELEEPESKAETVEPEVESVEEEKVEEEESKEEAEEPEAAEEEEYISDVSKKSIMVIDDSIVIRKMIEIALEEEDYRILTATSGKEGMETIEKESPNLIILDMVLPDMNGIDVLKKVKTAKKTPVIMLSGKDAPQLIESAKEIGVDDFLPKPFRDEELLEKVKSLLE
jgi:CheY-like chemotaxis protein